MLETILLIRSQQKLLPTVVLAVLFSENVLERELLVGFAFLFFGEFNKS